MLNRITFFFIESRGKFAVRKLFCLVIVFVCMVPSVELAAGGEIGDIDKLRREVIKDSALNKDWQKLKKEIEEIRKRAGAHKDMWDKELAKAIKNGDVVGKQKAEKELARGKRVADQAIDSVLDKYGKKGTKVGELARGLRRLGTTISLVVLSIYIDFAINTLKSPLIQKIYRKVLEGKYGAAHALVTQKKLAIIAEIDKSRLGIGDGVKRLAAEKIYEYFYRLINTIYQKSLKAKPTPQSKSKQALAPKGETRKISPVESKPAMPGRQL